MINDHCADTMQKAWSLVYKIDDIDDVRHLFTALFGLLQDKPNLSADDYLTAIARAAEKQGLM